MTDTEDSDVDLDDQNDELQEPVNEQQDEEDWMKFQEEAKKENILETKCKETHLVHCPYFPGVSIIYCTSKNFRLLYNIRWLSYISKI